MANKPVTLQLRSGNLTILSLVPFLRAFKINAKQHVFNVCDINSLIVLCSFAQGYPGLLWEVSWLGSSPADALALGVVDVPEIIQRSGLPNLQRAHQIFTGGNQSDQFCNYILKIH